MSNRPGSLFSPLILTAATLLSASNLTRASEISVILSTDVLSPVPSADASDGRETASGISAAAVRKPAAFGDTVHTVSARASAKAAFFFHR